MNSHKPKFHYNTAISTMWGVGQSCSFRETFEITKNLGFERFELNHKVTPAMLAEVDYDLYPIRNIHDPCPAVISMDEQGKNDWLISALEEQNREHGVRILKRTIDLAVELGARSVIVHPGSIGGDRSKDLRLRVLYKQGLKHTPEFENLRAETIEDRQRRVEPHLDAVVRSLLEISEYARPRGIEIGLENRYRYYDIPTVDEMQILLEVCNEEWYGFQYDIGHAYTLDELGLCSHLDWLERYSSRMIGMHLHDVTGLNDHQAPGTGQMDFKWISKYLPVSAHRTLEIDARVPVPEIIAGMEVLVDAGIVTRQ